MHLSQLYWGGQTLTVFNGSDVISSRPTPQGPLGPQRPPSTTETRLRNSSPPSMTPSESYFHSAVAFWSNSIRFWESQDVMEGGVVPTVCALWRGHSLRYSASGGCSTTSHAPLAPPDHFDPAWTPSRALLQGFIGGGYTLVGSTDLLKYPYAPHHRALNDFNGRLPPPGSKLRQPQQTFDHANNIVFSHTPTRSSTCFMSRNGWVGVVLGRGSNGWRGESTHSAPPSGTAPYPRWGEHLS